MGAKDDVAGPRRLREVAFVFTKLGVIGFGGPAAHVALMREEVVRRRGWIEDAEFLDYVGATNLIPGPNSTELAIHLGHHRAGTRGLLVAGLCFIAPAVVMVSVLAWLYARHGTDPAVVDLRYGVLPIIIAVVAHAVYGLARTVLRNVTGALAATTALAAYVIGINEVLILVVVGGAVVAWQQRARLLRDGSAAVVLFLPAQLAAEPRVVPRGSVSLTRLFLVFLEIGSVLYGSGYVLLAFLQRNVVEHHGWLTSRQLLDASAVGQITPGPVFTTATFVGWQIDGPAGAAVATIGIFLPSFVFVALLRHIVPWMRARPAARAFLTGVTAASLGLMAGVSVELADQAIVDLVTAAAAIGALCALTLTRVSPTWLVGAGLVLGGLHALG